VVVPLLVRDPRASGRIVPGAKRLVDLHEMVLGLAGVSAAPADGRRAGEETPILVHSEQASDLRAIVTGRYKLMADLRKGRVELYDLYADPAELHDLSGTQPELRRRLCTALAGHFETLEREAGRLRSDVEVELSQERTDQLETLGYVGGPSDQQAPDRLAALCSAGA
jgi:arylsulfatase A-like enzyme